MPADAPPILWQPSAEFRASTNLARYAERLRAEIGLDVTADDYEGLRRWSVGDLDGFWRSIWRFFDVQADGDPEPVLGRREMPGADWFPHVRLNHAEHVFRDAPDDRVADGADRRGAARAGRGGG